MTMNPMQNKNGYYHTCPLCGSNLDPGERCNCRDQEERTRRKISKSSLRNFNLNMRRGHRRGNP